MLSRAIAYEPEDKIRSRTFASTLANHSLADTFSASPGCNERTRELQVLGVFPAHRRTALCKKRRAPAGEILRGRCGRRTWRSCARPGMPTRVATTIASKKLHNPHIVVITLEEDGAVYGNDAVLANYKRWNEDLGEGRDNRRGGDRARRPSVPNGSFHRQWSSERDRNRHPPLPGVYITARRQGSAHR